ncbi:MAG: hypothetical protein VR65_24635 [Desulfobulbaceae bacterium BRH_c16a]|nr:MAG: hypothetical protein VR65_24635 [Desulfobulbaceae bacterium BRH_c16a]
MLVSFYKEHKADKPGIYGILLLVLFCFLSRSSSENHIKKTVIDVPAQFEQDVSAATEKDKETRLIPKKNILTDLHWGVVRKIPGFTVIQSVRKGASANTATARNTVNTATDNTIEDVQLSIVLEKSKANDAIIHLSVTRDVVNGEMGSVCLVPYT